MEKEILYTIKNKTGEISIELTKSEIISETDERNVDYCFNVYSSDGIKQYCLNDIKTDKDAIDWINKNKETYFK